jgi:chromosomal replication initiation ATPase DnaA
VNAVGQLALPFPNVPQFTRGGFLAAASNEDARIWLARHADWPQRRLALWGESGCGKTHLLRVWADEHHAKLFCGAALCGPADLPDAGAVAIDDADACPDPEQLLHLLNLAEEGGRLVLLAARLPPARWPYRLPDLVSRLRAITAVQILPARDGLLRALLAKLLAERQVAVPEAVQDWLLLRLPRTSAAVWEAAMRLNRLGLERGSAVGRMLAAEMLLEMRDDPKFQEDFASVIGDPSRCGPPLL